MTSFFDIFHLCGYLHSEIDRLGQAAAPSDQKIQKLFAQLHSVLGDSNIDLQPEGWQRILFELNSCEAALIAIERKIAAKTSGCASRIFQHSAREYHDQLTQVQRKVLERRDESEKQRQATFTTVDEYRHNLIEWLIAERGLASDREFFLGPHPILSPQDRLMILHLLKNSPPYVNNREVQAKAEELERALRKLQRISLDIAIEPKESDQTKLQLQLRNQFLYRIQHLQTTYELSMMDPSNQVASKFFPKTQGWFMGLYTPVSKPLVESIRNISKQRGIEFVVISTEKVLDYYDFVSDAKASEKGELVVRSNTAAIAANGEWSQDCVDFSHNGEVRVPFMNMSDESYQFPREKELGLARLSRNRDAWSFTEAPEVLSEEELIERMSQIPAMGAVFKNGASWAAISLAQTLQAAPIVNLAYNEGGNTLIGMAGQPPEAYAVIGRDSFEISKHLLKQIHPGITDDAVHTAFAIAYGIRKENLYFVEQPGDFHLDMSMALVGEKTVLLNDSVLAHEEFAAERKLWAEEESRKIGEKYPQDRVAQATEALQKTLEAEWVAAKRRKQLEDASEKDLLAQGFKVIRVAGKFNYHDREPVMNLFNMVTATTPGGKRIVVLLGCLNDGYREKFEEMLKNYLPDVEVEFLPFEASRDTLRVGGGIACRVKSIPVPLSGSV